MDETTDVLVEAEVLDYVLVDTATGDLVGVPMTMTEEDAEKKNRTLMLAESAWRWLLAEVIRA